MFKTVVIKNDQIEKERLEVPNGGISKVSSQSRDGYFKNDLAYSNFDFRRTLVRFSKTSSKSDDFRCTASVGVSAIGIRPLRTLSNSYQILMRLRYLNEVFLTLGSVLMRKWAKKFHLWIRWRSLELFFSEFSFGLYYIDTYLSCIIGQNSRINGHLVDCWPWPRLYVLTNMGLVTVDEVKKKCSTTLWIICSTKRTTNFLWICQFWEATGGKNLP